MAAINPPPLVEGVQYQTILRETRLYTSPDTKSNPITTIPSGTLVTVLEASLGERSDLALIEIVPKQGILGITDELLEKQLYIRSYLLILPPKETATEQDFDAETLSKTVNVPAIEISQRQPAEVHIKDLPIGIPAIENHMCYIVVDTGTKISSELNYGDIKENALKEILTYYGKTLTDDVENLAASPVDIIKVSNPYYPTRPGQNIRLKISIHEKYLNLFDDYMLEQFEFDNIHKNYIAINIRVNEIDDIVNSLSKILLSYHKQVSKFSGEIEGLNFKKMSNDIRNFLSNFKRFLRENGVIITPTNNSRLEIGFEVHSGAYSMGYVFYFNPYGRLLRIGTKTFCKLVDVNMSKLLINYKNVLSSSDAGMPWLDFCKEYFSGEYKVNFAKISDLASTAKKSLTNIEDELKNAKSDFEELSLMVPSDISGLSSLKNDPKFRETASELLLRSKDVVGDNFLINLPDILSNVEDLSSLYSLVFDKVSIKDLTDLMMENIGKNMNLPDLNEVKIRGILKKIDSEELLNIITTEIMKGTIDAKELFLNILGDYQFSMEEYLMFLDTITEFIAETQSQYTQFEMYFLHVDVTGDYGGLVPEHYPMYLNFQPTIDDMVNITETGRFEYDTLDYSAFFEPSFVFNMISGLINNNGLPSYEIRAGGGGTSNLGSVSLKQLTDMLLSFFKKLDKKKINAGLDNYMKKQFKDNNLDPSAIVKSFTDIPKVKTELDKINLTKKKFLKKVPGLNIDLETKKIDANFSMPKIKNVNPSFDFSKFEFKNTGDIFGDAVGMIEDDIVAGIETGLVASFKSMLSNVLDSITNNSPDIDNPDYGGLNINDILDATNGFGADMLANLTKQKLDFSIKKRKNIHAMPDSECSDLEEMSTDPSTEDIKKAFDDMSLALKPLEVTRILKGQHNSRDYQNMISAVQNPDLKLVLSEDMFIEILDICANYVDLSLLEELENAYNDKEVMISVCENAGIPYNRRNIKDDLSNQYPDLSDGQIDDLIETIVDDVKDSMVDAIGNMKENFEDNLPFDENPCSFMPKPSDIPAMDFVDDMTFDSIFDPIELEYKSEATTVPDLFMITTESDEYVPLYYYQFDTMLDGYEVNEDTGLPELKFITAGELDGWDELQDGNNRIYNEDFSNHYLGRSTELYSLENNRFIKLSGEEVPEITLDNEDKGQWSAPEDIQVYVKKQDQNLKPLPKLRQAFETPRFLLSTSLAVASNSISKPLIEIKLRDMNLYLSGNDYKLKFFKSGETSFNNIVIDPENVNEDCVESVNTRVSEANSNTHGMVVDMQKFIQQTFDDNHSGNFLSLKNNVHMFIEWKYNDWFNNSSPTYNTSFQLNTRKTIANHVNSRPHAPIIVGCILEQIMVGISKTKFFNTDDMLSFIIDDEDINLLKLEDTKNEAKDDYKDKCSFGDNEDVLQNSSTKKLIYLMIRIFVVEEVVRGCFMNDITYEKEASDQYCSRIFKTIESDLKRYPKGFYDGTFKAKYKETYGGEFDDNKMFRSIVKGIYVDVAENFDVIFDNAHDSIIKMFLEGCFRFKIPQNEKETAIPRMISESYLSYINRQSEDVFAGATGQGEYDTRFVIQRSVYNPDTDEEMCYGDAFAESEHNLAGNKVLTKLCFVMEVEGESAQLLSFEGFGQGAIKMKGWNGGSGEYPTAKDSDSLLLFRFKYSTSYQIGIKDADEVERRFVILPLAIHSSGAKTASDINVLLSSKDSPFVEFLKDIVQINAMREFIASSIQSDMLLEKPEISTMFADTKGMIKKALESLSADTYDYQELETKMVQLEQSSQQSTSPSFSPKASKMALMTVPMIIKGFAEMFDPNVKLASNIRKGFDLAGIDISPPVASLMAMPMNLIPFAPGPPIGPLGLLYLATTFLDPKERKRLSDLKRGKNLNPAANPETGTFAEGTLEEQAIEQSQKAIEEAKNAILNHEKMIGVLNKMVDLITREMNNLDDEGKGNIYLPGDKNQIKDMEGMQDYGGLNGFQPSRKNWLGITIYSDHIRLDKSEDEDNGNATALQKAYPWGWPNGKYGNNQSGNSNQIYTHLVENQSPDSRIRFIYNFFGWYYLVNDGTRPGTEEFYKKFYHSYHDQWSPPDDIEQLQEELWGTTSHDIRKVMEYSMKAIHRINQGLMYTAFVINEVVGERIVPTSEINKWREKSGFLYNEALARDIAEEGYSETVDRFDDVINQADTYFYDFMSTFDLDTREARRQRFAIAAGTSTPAVISQDPNEYSFKGSIGKFSDAIRNPASEGKAKVWNDIFALERDHNDITHIEGIRTSEVILPDAVQELVDAYAAAKYSIDRLEEDE